VEVAERYADGMADEEALNEARAGAAVGSYVFIRSVERGAGLHKSSAAEQAAQAAAACAEVIGPDSAPPHDLVRVVAGVARSVALTASWSAPESVRTQGKALAHEVQANLLLDIFGPLPFWSVTVHSDVLAWNDQLVVRLAQAIYDERRWGDMPILGDALLDAGCDNEEVLAHCRAGGEHVRGCWVVDLLLGKE
jgi:hypothetical protein